MAIPKKYQHIDFKPPKSVAEEAATGLKYRSRSKGKGGLNSQQANKEGVGSGVQRAVNLKNRNKLSPNTVKRMKAFFDRHSKNKSVPDGKRPWEDRGYVAWKLWGGDSGYSWSKKIVRQMESANKKTSEESTKMKKISKRVKKNASVSSFDDINLDHMWMLAEENGATHRMKDSMEYLDNAKDELETEEAEMELVDLYNELSDDEYTVYQQYEQPTDYNSIKDKAKSGACITCNEYNNWTGKFWPFCDECAKEIWYGARIKPDVMNFITKSKILDTVADEPIENEGDVAEWIGKMRKVKRKDVEIPTDPSEIEKSYMAKPHGVEEHFESTRPNRKKMYDDNTLERHMDMEDLITEQVHPDYDEDDILPKMAPVRSSLVPTLLKIANKLDKIGQYDLANEIDSILEIKSNIKKASKKFSGEIDVRVSHEIINGEDWYSPYAVSKDEHAEEGNKPWDAWSMGNKSWREDRVVATAIVKDNKIVSYDGNEEYYKIVEEQLEKISDVFRKREEIRRGLI